MECESDCKGVLFRCGPHPIDEAKIIYIKESETGITIGLYKKMSKLYFKFLSSLVLFAGRGEDKPGFQCLLSTYVSRLHLKIWSVGGIWYIQDLNSFNGTYVYNMVFNNGSTLKLRPHETYTLLPNSAIGFGMCPIVWLSKHTYIFDPGL